MDEIEQIFFKKNRGIDIVNGLYPTNLVKIESDFFSASPPFGAGLGGVAISGGTISPRQGSKNHPGVVALRDGTTANGGYRIYTDVTAINLCGEEEVTCIWKLSSSRNTVQIKIGFHDAANSTAPLDGCYFNYEGSTGLVQGITRNNNTQTISSTSFTPVVGTWYKSIIILNVDATSASFKIYNELNELLWEDVITTNIPVATGRETGMGVLTTESTTDAAADIIEIDYICFVINRIIEGR